MNDKTIKKKAVKREGVFLPIHANSKERTYIQALPIKIIFMKQEERGNRSNKRPKLPNFTL
jgi:hypothetical protein